MKKNLTIEKNKREVDDIVEASTIATDIVKEILLEEGRSSNELKDFMSGSQREILRERVMKDIDSKSKLFDDILTHDLKAKELQFRAMLDKSKRKRTVLKTTIAVACTTAAAVLAISFFVLNNSKEDDRDVIVSVSPQKSHVIIPTIITGEQQVIGISGDMKNIEEKMSYVSVNEKVVNYDIQGNANREIIETNKLIVPALFTQKLILQDGTEVTVNSCSELEYPVKFSGENREVTLRGEAYFKVAKSDKPFIVKMNESYVKVLGTEFNVNARESDLIKTVLVKGSVAVGFNDNTVMMKPNEIAIIDKKSHNIEVSPTDIYRHIAWMDGYSEFINEDFSNVIKELSSWYGVDFIYNVTEFKNTKLNISIEKSLTLIETFSKLKMAINLSININKEGQYEIKRVKR